MPNCCATDAISAFTQIRALENSDADAQQVFKSIQIAVAGGETWKGAIDVYASLRKQEGDETDALKGFNAIVAAKSDFQGTFQEMSCAYTRLLGAFGSGDTADALKAFSAGRKEVHEKKTTWFETSETFVALLTYARNESAPAAATFSEWNAICDAKNLRVSGESIGDLSQALISIVKEENEAADAISGFNAVVAAAIRRPGCSVGELSKGYLTILKQVGSGDTSGAISAFNLVTK